MSSTVRVQVRSYYTHALLAELAVDPSSDTVECLLRAIAGIKALSDAENPLRFVTRMWYLPGDTDAQPIEMSLHKYDRNSRLGEAFHRNQLSSYTVLIQGCMDNKGALTELYCEALRTSEQLRSQVADLEDRLAAFEKYPHNGNRPKHNMEVNKKNDDGLTPLHLAVIKNMPDSADIQALAAGGADVNLKTGADVYAYSAKTPLWLAVNVGNLAAVEALIRARADVNRRENNGSTPLHEAASNGNTAIIGALVAAHADVNNITKADDRTPLHLAAHEGYADAVNALAAAGADVNAVDEGGMTPLHTAIFGGDPMVVETLIAYKADVCRRDFRLRSALDLAANFGLSKIAELLIAAGADLNTVSYYGHTPLHTVATAEDEEIQGDRIGCMKVLIAAGASPIELVFEERMSMNGSALRLLKETGRLL